MARRRLIERQKPTSAYRKKIPIGVKLEACLLALGFTLEEIREGVEWDHDPALNLRFEDPATGELVPHPNDPNYIVPLRKPAHREKTFGPGGEKRIHTRGSDISEPIRTEKVAQNHLEFQKRLLAPKKTRAEKKAKPKRAWGSRPFNTRKKP